MDASVTPPQGRCALLFTDIEASTPMVARLGEGFSAVLEVHHRIIRAALATHGGYEAHTGGDSFFAIFPDAASAAAAAIDAQRALRAADWPAGGEVHVRMGIHVGTVAITDGEYVGLDIHHAHRISDAAHGDQILVSAEARAELPEEISTVALGSYSLRGIDGAHELHQIEASGLPRWFPRVRTPDPAPTNLPEEMSSLVGRASDIERVHESFDRARCVTIVGTGGVGKTRVALRSARERLGRTPGGVWFVDLAPVGDAALLEQTMADALGLAETGSAALRDAIVERLRGAPSLVVLDNCEHLIDDVARLTHDLLTACGPLQILATSREPLRVPGEATLRLQPLGVAPVPDAPAGSYDAGVLLLDRARLADPDVVVDDVAIAQICTRVDGIPLAIELAAALAGVMDLAEVAARLDNALSSLVLGPRTVPERQQTLRGAIAWSYDLLGPELRRPLRACGIFSGGFTAQTVAKVVGGAGEEELAALHARSLLTRADDGRYRMLETVREFAREQLQNAGEFDRIGDAHVEWVARFAQEAIVRAAGAQQAEWLAEFEAEHDNVRAALRWACDHQQAHAGAQVAIGATRYWSLRAHFTEGTSWCAAVLEIPGLSLEDEAKVLNCRAGLVASSGRYEEALVMFERCEALFSQLNDAPNLTKTYLNHGAILCRVGRIAQGLPLLQSAVDVLRESDDRFMLQLALTNLGAVLHGQGHYAEAERVHRETLEISREIGNPSAIARAIGNLGDAAHALGRFDEARELYTESVALRRELNDRLGLALALNNLATVVLVQGDPSGARALLEEALTIRREIGDMRGEAFSLMELGDVEAAEGNDQAAYRLWESSLALRRRLGETDQIGVSLRRIGDARARDGHTEQARASYLEAVENLAAAGNVVETPRALMGLLGVTEDARAQAFIAGMLERCLGEAELPGEERDAVQHAIRDAVGVAPEEAARARDLELADALSVLRSAYPVGPVAAI